MPELPEVQTVLDGLEAAVKDRIIADLQGYYPGTVRLSPGVPEGCFRVHLPLLNAGASI
jgi:hypothetical protein